MADSKKTGTTTSGRFYWHELAARDVEAQKGFYGELFGWSMRSSDMGPMGIYTVASAGGTEIAGITKARDGKTSWLAYCTVKSVDDAVARAKAAGAKVETPPMDIPEIGRFAVLVDRQGARIAPFRPVAESAESKDPPGLGTFCWNELVTQDPASAVAIYRDTFEWTTEDKDMGPMGTYTILKRGDVQAAGIMKAMMPKAPSQWLGYVVVSDVDAAFAKAQRLKGTALLPPAEIPGIGRFAVVADPEGASVALFKG